MSDRIVRLSVQRNGNLAQAVAREKPMPEVGEYEKRVRFNRFGQARRFDVTIRVTSPIASDLMGAVAQLEVAGD